MKIKNEKDKFSERLATAIKAEYPKGLTTSQIAIKFGLLHPTGAVTPQAVYKWLNGLAIPSFDKIETLSKWLNVEPNWLRYGGEEEQNYSALDEVLIRLIKDLNDQQKSILVSLITSFK